MQVSNQDVLLGILRVQFDSWTCFSPKRVGDTCGFIFIDFYVLMLNEYFDFKTRFIYLWCLFTVIVLLLLRMCLFI